MSKKEITVYASDDLVTRSKKIVEALGFRGAVGDHVLDVYNILKAYEKLDSMDKSCPEQTTEEQREVVA